MILKRRSTADDCASSQEIQQHYKRIRKPTMLQLIAVACCLAILVLAGLRNTQAWYIITRSVTQTSGNIGSDSIALSVESYKILHWEILPDKTEDERYHLDVDYELNSTDTDDGLVMLPYDAILHSNEKTPLIICIPLKGSEIQSGDQMLVTLQADTSASGNLLTDYVTVRAAILQDLVKDDSNNAVDDSDVYDALVDDPLNLKAWTQAKSVLTQYVTSKSFSTSNGVKSVQFPISCDTDDLDDGTAYLYIMLEYNENAIKTYLKSNRTTVRLGETTSEITFTADIQSITVTKQSS